MYDLKDLHIARSLPGYLSEDNEQAFLVQWTKRHGPPEASRLLHIPNGGHRSKSQGALLKLTGVQKGVPDLFLPVPRNFRHGLWIELKSLDPKSRPTKEQQEWLAYLEGQGYAVAVCRGFEAARDEILNYLNPPTIPNPGVI